MNVRRGLFRLWVVATLLWLIVVAFLTMDSITKMQGLDEVAGLALVPPAVTFALGSALVWAFSGFSRGQ